MPKSRAEIYDMEPEVRAKFMQERWGLVKKACDAFGKDAQDALADLKPSLYGFGGTRVGGVSGSKHIKFYELFKNVGAEVGELDVFKALKIGEREAVALIKTGLQKAEPKDRKWISFKDGVYKLQAIGVDAPKGWEGYVPKLEAPKSEAPKSEAPKSEAPKIGPEIKK